MKGDVKNKLLPRRRREDISCQRAPSGSQSPPGGYIFASHRLGERRLLTGSSSAETNPVAEAVRRVH